MPPIRPPPIKVKPVRPIMSIRKPPVKLISNADYMSALESMVL